MSILIGIVLFATAFLVLYWVFYGQRRYNEMLNPKRKTELKAMIFDFDGVLIDSFDRQHSVFNDLKTQYGLKKLDKGTFKKQLWGNSLEVNAKKIFSGIDLKDIRKKYVAATKKHKEEGRIMEGANKVLGKIKEKKLKIGLVTNTTRERATNDLKFYKLSRYFETVVTADDVEKPKPYPDSILKACKNLNVEPDEIMYIGDTKNDYKAGKAAGAFVVGFNTHGDLTVGKLTDLLRLL